MVFNSGHWTWQTITVGRFFSFTMITICTPASGVTAHYVTSGFPHVAHSWLLVVLWLAFGLFQVHMRVFAFSDSSALHTWWTSALGAAQTAPTTAMPWTCATQMDHLAGSATAPSSSRVYLKYAIPVQDLKQGLEPRLCIVSVVTSHLQDVVLLALIVGEHLQVRFA